VALNIAGMLLQIHGNSVSIHMGELLGIVIRRMSASNASSAAMPYYFGFCSRFVLVDHDTFQQQWQVLTPEWAAMHGASPMDAWLQLWISHVWLVVHRAISECN
jgi:hypothetical protein